MRTKVTLVLLFLNVALFFFIFYLKSGIAPPVDSKSSILGPEVVNIQRLDIAGPSRPVPVQIERRGEVWVLTQPVDWPANEHAVTTILTELQQLRSEASFAVKDLAKNGQSLADYGLDSPTLLLTLTPGSASPGAAAPHPSTLKIGDAAKVGNRLYVLSPDGERVHVVRRSLAESLLVKLEDLRSAEIFSIPIFEVRSFNLQVGAPANSKVRIARKNSRWFFETPIIARASKSETDTTVTRLNSLHLQAFVDPRTSESLRLTPEEMTMRVTLEGNNRSETLILGARVRDSDAAQPRSSASTASPAAAPSNDNAITSERGELYYAKMDGEKSPVFTVIVPTALLNSITTAQESLRDRRILDADPAAITALTISAPNQPDVTLQRLESTSTTPLNSGWQLIRRRGDRSPQTLAADRETVARLIKHLCELSAKEFTADAPQEAELENYGFNRPARHVRVALASPAATSGGTATTAGLLLGIGGIGAERRVYAKLDTPNYVYLVSDEILSQVPIDPLAYRERLLRNLEDGAKITAIKLADLTTQTVLLDTPFPLPPSITNPLPSSAPVPTPAAIEILATQLRTIRAKRFIRDEFTKTVTLAGEERPWKYQLTVTLSLVGGNGSQIATVQLFFSERIGGNTQLAGDPEMEVVFEAEQPLIDALFAVTYGPRDPGATPPPASEATGASEKPTK